MSKKKKGLSDSKSYMTSCHLPYHVEKPQPASRSDPLNAWLKYGIAIALLLSFVPEAGSQSVEARIRQLDAEARTAEQQGHLDAAIQKYQEILKLNPKLPVAYNNIGRLYYQQKQFHEALEPLKRAAELAPGLEAPRTQLGFCYYQTSDFSSARQEFLAALKLNPRDGLVKLFLARSLLDSRGRQGRSEVSGAAPTGRPQECRSSF